ncbi:uncharacterized protein LOC106637326 [Copidosoma floridanum]|uniref:uncharacterized protein LOC106637326 n=1 Tax=Copidosoma floridanum TaxID=29053 RepID=UPI0006C996CE|nr:uncharacterized protein LOC106637326 [Copidosoma floridanum]
MPRVASDTGLIAARVRPVRRPKPKKVELLGLSMPAPFTLRPFAGLFNPYPDGCSVLCNHPADGDVKDVVRKAKDNWTNEGKALLLPGDVELIRAGLRPVPRQTAEHDDALDATQVPEELFRHYTETDSRPTSPQPGVAPNVARPVDTVAPEPPRPTLVLDLRASSHEVQENETLSWHALTLEPIPMSTRKSDMSSPMAARRKTPVSSRGRLVTSTSPIRIVPILEVSDVGSARSAPTVGAGHADIDEEGEEDEDDDNSSLDKSSPMRRRGKLRRKKRKTRRCSIYGLDQVREPPDPLETQVSQIDESSRRGSYANESRLEETEQTLLDKAALPIIKHDMPPSFLPPDVLKELSRHLDQETVEWEFNAKRRFALEEVLRVTADLNPAGRGARQLPFQPTVPNAPRLFYRQSARFELLDSHSLVGLEPLDYLGQHVYASETRKLIFERAFSRHREETSEGPRQLQGSNLYEALAEVLGRSVSSDEITRLDGILGDVGERRLDFRTWCGVCALAERILPELPDKSVDQAFWLERTDFEMLERRLKSVEVDRRLAEMLRLVRDS